MGIHEEVASGPFCLLVNSPWLLVFALCVFFLILSALNLYFWKGIHFSWSLDLILPLIFILLISTFWFRDLLRELNKKYEILLMVLFLAFFLFLASEALLFVSFFWASFHSSSSPTLGGAFVSLEISSSFLVFFFSFSFILAWAFISLQIKEFRVMGLSINDSVHSSLFFFLTGLHFFHLLVGLFLLSLLFWSCSFYYKNLYFISLRVSEVHLYL